MHADFSQCRYEINDKSHTPTEVSKKNPVVVKSILKIICKRFDKSGIGGNFNLNPKTQIKKTHFNIRGKYPHRYNEVNETL